MVSVDPGNHAMERRKQAIGRVNAMSVHVLPAGVRMRGWPARLLIVLLIAGFGATAVADEALDQQRKRCTVADPDTSILGCTAVIQSNHEPRESLAAVFYTRGNAYLSKGQLDRAIQDFDEAIRLDPNNAVAFASRGHAYIRKGRYDRAIQDFDEAIRLDPNAAFAFAGRGNAYYSKQQDDRAIQDFDEAIRLDRNDAMAFTNRGSAFHMLGQLDRAIQDFNEAIRLDPNNARAFFNRGVILRALGQQDRAAADFAKAGQLDPILRSPDK
jgi:tetratricopeptide (TPR) repeat protein